MADDSGVAVGAAVVGAPSLAREAVLAVLLAAGIDVVAPGQSEAVVSVLVDPSPTEWADLVVPGSKVVLVSTPRLEADDVLAAVLRGADAVVDADASSERLAHAVRVVAAGGTELSPTLVRRVADALRRHAQEEEHALVLTGRERQILASIDAGETVKQTARTIGIAPKTVENLQSRLFRKLGVRNRAQAIALAHSLGLVPPTAVPPDSDDDAEAVAP